MDQKKDMIVGIDLGTTYSCVAAMHGGRPQVIRSGKGYLTVPSVVGVSKKGEIVVGHAALDQMVLNPEETIYGSKRLVGRKYHSPIVQRMLKTMTYQIVEGDDGDAAVFLNSKLYSLSDIAGFILAEIKDMAQGQLGMEIHRAVITVPAYYNDNQRQAVVEAGKKAGFQVDQIVNEPTAAAIAYGFNKNLNQTILVYDLGGGTFDVSILKIEKNKFHVVSTGGDNFLGGIDIDTRVADYISEEFKKSTGHDLRTEKIAYQRLRGAVEHGKRVLSEELVARIELPFITQVKGKPFDLKMMLKRGDLEKLSKDIIDRTIQLSSETLKQAKLTPQQLDEILIVGGQTRMPLVTATVERFFGKQVRKGVHPDEVVALGAALLGESIIHPAGMILEDVLSIPIGIELPNGQFKVIIDRNSRLPSWKAFKLTGPETKQLEMAIFQGENSIARENEWLGSFFFPLPPKERRGEQRLEMKFELSAQCLLTVSATDLDTKKMTQAKLQAHKGVTPGGSEKGSVFGTLRRILGKNE